MFDDFLPIPDAESLPFYPLVLKLVVCVLGMAGASGVTVPRALALSSTPKKSHAPADPPPKDPADEPAPAPAAPAPAGSAGAQEPAPAASPPKAGGKGGVLERGSVK